MGCTTSKKERFDDVDGDSSKAIFECLDLSEIDVKKMMAIYNEICKEDLSTSKLTQVVLYLKMEDETRFISRVFNVFNTRDGGSIQFRTFVVALWSYCTLPNAHLTQYIFNMFYQDGSHRMDGKDIVKTMKELYGKRFENNTHAVKVASKLEQDLTPLELVEFSDICRKFPVILFPAVELRDSMRQCICGERFWVKQEKNRAKMCEGQYFSVRRILKYEGKPCAPRTLGEAYEDDDDHDHGSHSADEWDVLHRKLVASQSIKNKSKSRKGLRRLASNGADILREKSRELAKLLQSTNKRDRDNRPLSTGSTKRQTKIELDQKKRKMSITDHIALGIRSMNPKQQSAKIGAQESEVGNGMRSDARRKSITEQIYERVKRPKKEKGKRRTVTEMDVQYKRERKMSMAQKVAIGFRRALSIDAKHGKSAGKYKVAPEHNHRD